MRHATSSQLKSLFARQPRCSGQARLNPHGPAGWVRTASSGSHPPLARFANLIYGSALLATLSFAYVYVTDTRASVHRFLVPPLLRRLFPDPEDAHHAMIGLLRELYALGLYPRERNLAEADAHLPVRVFGHQLTNPIGLSAGLDKNGQVPDALLALGPSIVEIGGITPQPQPGNPRPRLFRIPSQQALVNRYGLNSDGADLVAARLRQRLRHYALAHASTLPPGPEEAEDYILNGHAGVPPGSLATGKLLAIQIAKNKATPDDDLAAVVADHVYGVQTLGKFADILVVNVSSPNTPGLRAFQSQAPLTRILSAVVQTVQQLPRQAKPAVMVKVSPDESAPAQVQGICDAVWASQVDGIIIGNTTKLRPQPELQGIGLPARDALVLREQGGFSGPQLFERTLSLVRLYRQTLQRGPPPPSPASSSSSSPDHTLQNPPYPLPAPKHTPKTLFASGGITNGEQAVQVLQAGASVAMIYTTMLYNGVGTFTRIKDEIRQAIQLPPPP